MKFGYMQENEEYKKQVGYFILSQEACFIVKMYF